MIVKLTPFFAVTIGVLAKDNALKQYKIRDMTEILENQFEKAKFGIRECLFTFFEHREYRRCRRKYRGRFLTIYILKLIEVQSKPLETVSTKGLEILQRKEAKKWFQYFQRRCNISHTVTIFPLCKNMGIRVHKTSKNIKHYKKKSEKVIFFSL